MAKNTDSVEIQYLKQDKIGKVIAQGLSQLYQEKPQKPVTYLAHWLLAYSENLKKTEGVQKLESAKVEASKTFHSAESVKVQLKKKLTSRKQEETSVLKAFQKLLSSHEYHYELLSQQFPEFLEKSKGLTGVYIGQLNHPPKEVKQEDTDENAHLQIDIPKVINYIGSSKSHKGLMIGKALPLDKGVTAQAFTLSLDEPIEGEEKKKKFVYVPDVVKNEKIHYFKIPKLGAYIAIPLIFKSYLFEHMFDTALEEHKKYLHLKDQFEKDKHNQLQQIAKELEDSQARLKVHEEKNEAEQVVTVQQQVKDIEIKQAQKEKELLQYVEPELEAQKRELVVCADTLGQDRQISEEQQEFLVHFVKKFKQQFEKNELRLLKQDVSLQIAYQQSLGRPYEELDEEFKKELQIDEEKLKELTQTYKQEKEINYQSNIIRCDRLKQQFSRPEVRQWFVKLSEFRTIKFPSLLQHLLYFLGYTKNDIDIPNTTHLNWKKVRTQLPSQSPIKKLLAYEFRGAKPNPVKNYAKVTYLTSVFDKYPEEEVSRYNIALGIALKIMKLLLSLRIQDVEIRKQKTEQLKKEREEKLAENEKIEEDKANALEQHKATIPPEEIESFNEVQWLKNHDQQHPLVEIPPEIVDDIDNDI